MLYIHLNKNKFYVARILESVLYNVVRSSIMMIVFNVVFSNSILTLILVVGSMIYNKRKTEMFLNLNSRFYALFCAYFVLNWVLLRNNFIDAQPESDLPWFIDWFIFVKTKVFFIRKEDQPNILLLGSFVALCVGYGMILVLIRFVCTNLFLIKKNTDNSAFHLVTKDKYLVIDYKKWKKGEYSSMNIFYKLSHVMLVEIYAAVVFCLVVIDTNS